MSLTRIGLRTAAIEALRHRTLAGADVLDSEIGVLETRSDGTVDPGVQKRFIAVYTQATMVERPEQLPRGLLDGGLVELIFEMGITAAMLVRDEATGKQEIFEGMPATDAAFELYLDLLGRQIVDCLLDPASDWAEIWRGFVHRVVKVERLRTDNAQSLRLAGHQLKITCEVIDDPVQGAELDAEGALARLLAKLETEGDADAQTRAGLLRSVLVAPAPDSVAQAGILRGLTAPEMTALGLVLPGGDGAAEDVAEVTIAVAGRSDLVQAP